MATKKAERCEVIFRGRVQGVGFRWTTKNISSRYVVTGYVLNKRDGSVRMVAEGTREDVSQLTRSVLETMSSHVTSHTEAWGEATGEFADFAVRATEP